MQPANHTCRLPAWVISDGRLECMLDGAREGWEEGITDMSVGISEPIELIDRSLVQDVAFQASWV